MKILEVGETNRGSSKSEGPTFHLLITSVITTLAAGFHFGYLISAVNPLSTILQQFIVNNIKLRFGVILNEEKLAFVWSSLVGCLFIGAIIGSYLAIHIIAIIGPKRSLLISSTIIILSAPIFGLSSVLEMAELMPLSRVLSGVGVGIGIATQAVYLTEISPTKYRGATNSFGGLIGNIAFLIASVLGTPHVLGTDELWKNIFFMETIPCFIHIIFNIFYLYESPKFLLKIGDEKEARKALRAFNGSSCTIKTRLEELQSEIYDAKNEKSMRNILKDRASLLALSLAFAINFSVAFSGIVAISFFGTILFESVGFTHANSTLANCLSSFAGVISALLASVSIDKIGRRFLLISSLITLALINSLMMLLVILYNETSNEILAWPFLILFLCFIFVFSIGIGPVAMFLGAELAPPGTTSKIQSYSVSVQYLGSFICPILYLSLASSIGAASFLLFIIPLVITSMYLYRYLPETKGRTNYEISVLLTN